MLLGANSCNSYFELNLVYPQCYNLKMFTVSSHNLEIQPDALVVNALNFVQY